MKGFVRVGMASVLATGVMGAAFAQTPQDVVHAVAGRGIGDGRPATAATLDTPAGVAIAPDGGLLIADMLHHRIRRVDPTSGAISTYMGTFEGTLGDGAPPDVVQIKSPVRVLVRKNGDVLVVERGGPEIRRVRKDTGLVDTVPIGTNIPGFTLNQPNDVAEDSAGNLYVVDLRGTVYRLDPA
jgi:streptogramin lyase